MNRVTEATLTTRIKIVPEMAVLGIPATAVRARCPMGVVVR
jgi:hypothetical protein